MILDNTFKTIEGFSNYMVNPLGEIYNLKTAKQQTLNNTWYNLKCDKTGKMLKISRRELLLHTFPDIYRNKSIPRLSERDTDKLEINIEKKNITLVF
tara:strand:+ start:860 stop:1150 length:291 start_codon:yes stop_codon:yes gene_type:complete